MRALCLTQFRMTTGEVPVEENTTFFPEKMKARSATHACVVDYGRHRANALYDVFIWWPVSGVVGPVRRELTTGRLVWVLAGSYLKSEGRRPECCCDSKNGWKAIRGGSRGGGARVSAWGTGVGAGEPVEGERRCCSAVRCSNLMGLWHWVVTLSSAGARYAVRVPFYFVHGPTGTATVAAHIITSHNTHITESHSFTRTEVAFGFGPRVFPKSRRITFRRG